VKCGGLQWNECIAAMEDTRSAYKPLVGKFLGKWPFGRQVEMGRCHRDWYEGILVARMEV
jgi:hypothetical protein